MANEVNIVVKTKGTKQAKKQFKEVSNSTATLKKAALGLGAALGARSLGRQIGAAVNRAEEMNSAYAITEQVLVQTQGAANVTAQEIKTLSKEQSLLTGVDKKLVTEGNNVLLTFKNIANQAGEGNKIFARTSEVMLDLGAVLGGDAKSAAIQLGKALNDPIKGVASLQRIGVTFTDQQKEQIRTMQASGDILGAQKIILAELESQVGGTAEASADATDKIANSFKEMQEAAGNAILPIIEGLVPAFVRLGGAAPAIISNITLGFSAMENVLRKATFQWTEQNETLFQVNRRMGEYAEKMAGGSNEGNVFAGVLVDLSNKGDAFEGTLKTLIETTGVSNAGLREAIGILLSHANQYGLSATQVDNLKRELLKLNLTEAAAAKITGIATEETKKFDKAVRNLDKSVGNLGDPVARAITASANLAETLVRIQEDGEVTGEELIELRGAVNELQEAEEAVDATEILAFGHEIREDQKLLNESTRVTAGFLEELPFKATNAFRQTEAAFLELIKTPMTVRVEATLPPQSAFARATRIAIEQARRRGDFGGGFQP